METLTAQRSLDKFVKQDAEIENKIFTVETDIEQLLDKLKFVGDLFPDSVVMLCNATHANFNYISQNFTEYFGHSIQYFSDISSRNFFAEIHPDDVAPLGLCYDFMVRHVEGLTIRDLLELRFVMHYRFRHASGQYLHVKDEKIMMESRHGRHVGITLLKDVSAGKNVGIVKLQVLKKLKKKFVVVEEYCPAQAGPVSSREADILALAKEGFRNQEIADRLSISINTVKNHKKSLFRKMQVKSSLALIRSAAQ